jgi:hypothetical protein
VEVGWFRNALGDVLLLRTEDGKQIKSVGAGVANTGEGRRRVLRMLSDIERAWAHAG